MSRGFIPQRIVNEILEIARHRGDFVLFPTGELYDCGDPQPEHCVLSGISAGRTGMHYYHVGISTRPVKRELLFVFMRPARTLPEEYARLREPAGDPGSGRCP
jgi:hypothetical protein